MIYQSNRHRGSATGNPGISATMTEVRNSNPSGAKERNRILQIFTRSLRGILTTVMACLVSVFSYAADPLMTYVGCTPEPGSEIENLDFKLTFDISNVIATNGEAEYGISVIGDPDYLEYCTFLYEGEGDTKTLLATALINDINGQSNEFEVGNTLQFSFPNIVLKSGTKYTLVIGNSFGVCVKGSTKSVKKASCNFQMDQLVYVYTAKASSDNVLTLEEVSIPNDTKLDVLSSVTYKFNAPFTLVDGVKATLSLNDIIVASSSSLEVNYDTNELTVKFDDVVLYNQNKYTVTLPEGIVCLKDNESSVNKAFSFNVSGTNFNSFGIKTSEPADNSTVLTNTVQITFDLPADYKLLTSMGDSSNFSASLYKDAVSEDNLVKGNVMGNPTSDGKVLEWSFGISPEPSTKYILYIPKSQFGAWKGKVYDYSNEEITLVYSTPSVAESGISKVEFKAPVLGKFDPNGETLKVGDKVSSIDRITFVPTELKYTYNGGKYPNSILESPYVNLYDITDGTPILINSYRLSSSVQETIYEYYNVFYASLNAIFYEGHKYRLVLPAGSVAGGPIVIRNYASNDEVAIDFEGATPTTVELLSCSLAENAELSELPCVTWKFKGSFVRNPELSANLVTPSGGGYDPTFVSVNNNAETVVQAFFYFDNGKPFSLRSGAKYTLILPEGIIYNAGDPSIKNEEMRINLTGIEKTPEVIKPEYVNVTVEVNGIATVEQQAVKGEKTTINLTPTEDWKVESVSGATLSGVNAYTTPTLTADATVKVELAYDGPWATEISSNVYEIDTENILIYKDGNFIIVEGAKPDQTICVYNIAGLLVNTANSADGMDKVILTVSQNQEYYIVTVAGKAAKIKM